MDLVAGVEAYIRRYHLLSVADTLVVGVSGGPDSVALLDLLHQLGDHWKLNLHVAHLHHGIRGADADEDARFVMNMAERYGLPCTVERVDLPRIAQNAHLAIEEAARRVRYGFLARVAKEAGARRVAVAHNADDQAETVLMHLLRGAGPAGLRGMLPVAPLHDELALPAASEPIPDLWLVRPLLATPRAEIEAYCTVQALETRFDRSNLDTTFFRNYLRHEVLPYLAQSNPRIHARLCNLAEVVRADYELLEEQVDRAWESLLLKAYPDGLIFDLEGWRAQPLAIRRALVRRAAYALRRTLRDVDFAHVDGAVALLQEGTTGGQATLPRGLMATLGYTTLKIGDIGAVHLPEERPWLVPGQAVQLQIPGETLLPGGWKLSARQVPDWDMGIITGNADPLVAWMDADALQGTVQLRTRRPGDRFSPQGLEGAEVKLSDFLINVKVPRSWRNALPLLEVGGEIRWVVGLRLSDAAQVGERTERVMRVAVTRVGEAGPELQGENHGG